MDILFLGIIYIFHPVEDIEVAVLAETREMLRIYPILFLGQNSAHIRNLGAKGQGELIKGRTNKKGLTFC
jgi:hypothetical protein